MRARHPSRHYDGDALDARHTGAGSLFACGEARDRGPAGDDSVVLRSRGWIGGLGALWHFGRRFGVGFQNRNRLSYKLAIALRREPVAFDEHLFGLTPNGIPRLHARSKAATNEFAFRDLPNVTEAHVHAPAARRKQLHQGHVQAVLAADKREVQGPGFFGRARFVADVEGSCEVYRPRIIPGDMMRVIGDLVVVNEAHGPILRRRRGLGTKLGRADIHAKIDLDEHTVHARHVQPSAVLVAFGF